MKKLEVKLKKTILDFINKQEKNSSFYLGARYKFVSNIPGHFHVKDKLEYFKQDEVIFDIYPEKNSIFWKGSSSYEKMKKLKDIVRRIRKYEN